MKRYRILHIMNYYIPGMGYQENYLPAEQKKLGLFPFIITSDRYPPIQNYDQILAPVLGSRIQYPDRFKDKEVEILRLPVILENIHHTYVLLKGLYRSILKINPDIIHLHGVSGYLVFQVLIINSFLNMPLVMDSHTCYFNVNPYNFKKRFYYKILKRLVYPCFKSKIKKMLPINEDAKVFLKDELNIQESKLTILPLGTDVKTFYFSEIERVALRKKLGFNPNDVVAIHSGKLSDRKQTSFLVNSLTCLFSNFPSFKLLIVGSGSKEYMDSIRFIVKENDMENKVFFYPFAQRNVLRKFYNAADIGIWPGDPSITIQEAMACKLPIIVQDHRDTKELNAYTNGIVVRRGDKAQLLSAISKLVLNKKLREDLGEKSLQLVQDILNWKSIAQRSIELYREALGRP